MTCRRSNKSHKAVDLFLKIVSFNSKKFTYGRKKCLKKNILIGINGNRKPNHL